MSLVKWAFIGVLLLPAAELLTFLVVAGTIGWLATILLFLATSAVGVLLLRRGGRDDLDRLKAAFAQDGLRAARLGTPGFAPILAGILLVIPGFLTDILGALLLVPAFREWASAALGRAARRRPQQTGVIELEPGEWHQLPDQGKKRRRKSAKGT